MQIFADSKWHFHSFIEFFLIHLKNQEVKFDHSGTLKSFLISGKCLYDFIWMTVSVILFYRLCLKVSNGLCEYICEEEQ